LCFVLPILSSNCLKTKKWGPPTKEPTKPTSPTKTWHIFFISQQKKKNYLSIKQKENKHLTRDLEREFTLLLVTTWCGFEEREA
jgi:hypothetical protein